MAAAIGGIPTSGDQLPLLKLVEQANNIARIQAEKSALRLLARGSALAEQPQSDEMTGAKPPRLKRRFAGATGSAREVVNQGQQLCVGQRVGGGVGLDLSVGHEPTVYLQLYYLHYTNDLCYTIDI